MKFKIAIFGLLLTFSSFNYLSGQDRTNPIPDGQDDGTETENDGGIFDPVIVTRSGDLDSEVLIEIRNDEECVAPFEYPDFIKVSIDMEALNPQLLIPVLGETCDLQVLCTIEADQTQQQILLPITYHDEGAVTVINESFDYAECIDGVQHYTISLQIACVNENGSYILITNLTNGGDVFDLIICCEEDEGRLSNNSSNTDQINNYTLTVYDQYNNIITSRQVDKQTADSFNINDLDLKQGIYIYTVRNGKSMTSQKVFKN